MPFAKTRRELLPSIPCRKRSAGSQLVAEETEPARGFCRRERMLENCGIADETVVLYEHLIGKDPLKGLPSGAFQDAASRRVFRT